jgi:hypothetical protein
LDGEAGKIALSDLKGRNHAVDLDVDGIRRRRDDNFIKDLKKDALSMWAGLILLRIVTSGWLFWTMA